MKRVQAIVTGKKKQCTKLPTPSQPAKGKKSPTTPSGLPLGESTGTKTEKSSSVRTPTGEAAGVAASSKATSANSSRPLPSSVSTDKSTAGSTSATTSSGSKSPGSRTPSRIPASSPKKSRDAAGTPSGKGRLRLDQEEKPKKKPSLIRKLSLKDKHKPESRSRSKSDPPSDRSETGGSSSTGYVSSGEEARSRTTSRSESEVESQASVGTHSSGGSRTITPQPSQSQLSEFSFSQRRGSDSTIGKEDKEEKSVEKKGDALAAVAPQVSAAEANNNGTVTSKSNEPSVPQMNGGTTTIKSGTMNGYSSNPEQSYGNGNKSHSGGGAPLPRNGPVPRPMIPRGHTRPNDNPMTYPQGYVSLPRSSRDTTPTGEGVYSYGSLPRRSNSSTPTPQSLAYQNNIYGTIGATTSWGSLSRQGSSDSGFNMPRNVDRSRPSQRSANGNYYGGYPSDYHHLSRAGSVPPPGVDGHETMYCSARSDSVPPGYYSDSEYGRYQLSRGMRAGSVPLGYESEPSAYAEESRGMPRNYESDSGNEGRPSGLRVRPGDERYQAGPGKRPVPRRHTLGAPDKNPRPDLETERKREAFMNLLAQRYPQYADRIQSAGGSGPSTPIPQQQQQLPVEKPARAREPQRRRTAVVNYDPAQATNTLEYDDLGTMSDLELPSFQRGNYMRTSLPIVRSASTSLERPLGLVFLVYGDQTKKSLLPNEITTLDTVRALFVRAFTTLTMEMMEDARKKIYILDKSTNIYFQLEDLAEIMDRSVLKLHDTDNEEPQRVRERQEVRGRTIQMPLSRPNSRQGHAENPDYIKAHSVPPQASHEYQELIPDQRHQYDVERRSRSRTPEPTERPRYSHSPDRMPTPERGPLNPIPENRQINPGYREQGGNYYEPIGPVSPAVHRGQYSSGTYEVPPAGPYPAYPNPTYAAPQQPFRNVRAATMMHPQRSMAPGPIYDMRDGPRGSNPVRHSLPFAPQPIAPVDPVYQRSQSYRVPPTEREHEYSRSVSATPNNDKTKNRIEKMEAQLANLTAWVHYQKSDTQQRNQPRGTRSLGSTASDSSDTFPASSASKHSGEIPFLSTNATTNHVVSTKGLSDIPDGQKSSVASSGDSASKNVPTELSQKLNKLKSELQTLKRQQQLNMEAMKDEFLSAFSKIKAMCSSVPGSDNQVNFHNRTDMTENKSHYLQDKGQVTQELYDLESTVEELRNDVISRNCRVNISDVEGMALLLSNITKNLADLKAKFPDLSDKMKKVMDSEMRVVVTEEKFLKEEPVEIEGSLKRCKKLTETLYTLKRLALVQDQRPPHIPNVASADGMADSEQKKLLLENIKAMVPDHDQRVQHMEAADASRERKKKICTQQEALKFGKTLEIASKALRPPSVGDDKTPASEEESDIKEKPKSSTMPSEGHVPPMTIKSVVSTATHPPVYSHPITSTVSTGVATSVTMTSLAATKPSFSSTLASSANLPRDQQEVEEGAIYSSSSQNQQTQSKPSYTQGALAAGTRSANLPLTQTTERLSSNVHGGTGPVAPTVVTSESTKHPATSAATLGHQRNAHSIRPPVYSKPNTMGPLMRKERIAPLADKEDFVDPRRERPKSSPVSQAQLNYPKSVQSFDDDYNKRPETNGHVNGHSNSSGDEKPAAIHNSVNSPSKSSSSSSPVRKNSISSNSDVGGSVAKVDSSGTINLVLTGTVSPKSPTDPGTFTISPLTEVLSPPANMPSTPLRRDLSLSDDNASLSGSPAHGDSNVKQKKVPPPPPPRKGSRPTSTSGLPSVNGGVNHPQQETPLFVGGILGQHRLSGGPLSSTPKVSSQGRPMTTFEKDIATGIYANLNRPDLQCQTSSPQQMISQVTSNPTNSNGQENVPPVPSVSSNTINRDERGSSSESTSSSSGTSMGSQQSVVNIVRSGSLNVKSTKPKPEPPRRQSSLFSKSGTGRDTLVHDRKKTLNGVDL